MPRLGGCRDDLPLRAEQQADGGLLLHDFQAVDGLIGPIQTAGYTLRLFRASRFHLAVPLTTKSASGAPHSVQRNSCANPAPAYPSRAGRIGITTGFVAKPTRV